MATATFKMRKGNEFPEKYAGTEVPIEIPDLTDDADQNWQNILAHCAGDTDAERSKSALVTFAAALKLKRQKRAKLAAHDAPSEETLTAEQLAEVANADMATQESRDYGIKGERKAGGGKVARERDEARATASSAIAALERLRDSTQNKAARAAIEEELATLQERASALNLS
jgi:hypothetical protein